MKKDVLVHLVVSLPTTLDPAVGYDSPSMSAIQNIYETLVTYTGSEVRQVVPLLAESWTVSPDNRRFTFHLRPGVQFHNGHPLTAECVVYSLQRVLRLNQGPAWILSQGLSTSGLRSIDEVTVEITLTRPFPAFPFCLANTVASIVDPAVVEANGGVMPNQANAWLAKHAVGTGPLMLGQWQPESKLVLLRNPSYWRECAKLAEVHVQQVCDTAVRKRALLCGKVDLADVSNVEAWQLSDQPGIGVVGGPGLDREMIGFNCRRAPFDDVRVRQAVAYAIDYEALLSLEPGYQFYRTDGPIPTQIEGHAEDWFCYPCDRAKAKALLQAAGYAHGFATTLTCNEFWQRQRITEIVANSLRAVQIEVRVEALPWVSFVNKLAQGTLPMFAWNWVPDYPDPDSYVYPIYHSHSIENQAGYYNPTIDSLIEIARIESDPAKRADLYREIQHIVIQDAPYLFMVQGLDQFVHRRCVRGIVYHPLRQTGEPIDYYPLYKDEEFDAHEAP